MMALDVARAALMEVGSDPSSVWVEEWGGRDALIIKSGDDDAFRAALLGFMAENGGDEFVQCDRCAERFDTPCTPARDVLRGVRCGK